MRAIILAAGIGKRLGTAESDGKPKCLLDLGDQSLLGRSLETLNEAGIDDIVVVVGYQAADIEAEIDSLDLKKRPTTVLNREFEEGSVLSLWCAREFLDGEVLVMDADVLYHPDIVRRLVKSEHENLFLIDRGFEDGDEPVKLCVNDGRLVEFRKKVLPGLKYEFAGESVGFFKFSQDVASSIAGRCQDYVDGGRVSEPHEEVIRDELLDNSAAFSYEDVTGLPWIEIDFPEDVARARDEVLPRLS